MLLERRWDRFHKGEQDVEDWDLHWRPPAFWMARRLKHMWRLYGSRFYEFLPPTCIVPNDYGKFMTENFKEKLCRAGALAGHPHGGPPTPHSYGICKSAELSRRRGIIIFRDIKDFAFDNTCMVQKYICNSCWWARTNVTSTSTSASLALSL